MFNGTDTNQGRLYGLLGLILQTCDKQKSILLSIQLLFNILLINRLLSPRYKNLGFF